MEERWPLSQRMLLVVVVLCVCESWIDDVLVGFGSSGRTCEATLYDMALLLEDGISVYPAACFNLLLRRCVIGHIFMRSLFFLRADSLSLLSFYHFDSHTCGVDDGICVFSGFGGMGYMHGHEWWQ